MNLSRRTMGLGLLGAGAAFAVGVAADQAYPVIGRTIGLRPPLPERGFTGGATAGLLANPALAPLFQGVGRGGVEGAEAGSLEQCRERAILDQRPRFLWPGSGFLAGMARSAGAPVRQIVSPLRSPIVIHSWESVARALAAGGFVQSEGGAWFVDLVRLLPVMSAGQSWAALGAAAIPGQVRLRAPDPTRSAAGLLFAGLMANALSGGVATAASLEPHRLSLIALFRQMGFKAPSSVRQFEDYLAGGPGGAPLSVGYESQLPEWIARDPARWGRVMQGSPDRPVTLYPRPTILADPAFISLSSQGDRLAAVLGGAEARAIGWRDHALRGPQGEVGREMNSLIAPLVPLTLAYQSSPQMDVLNVLLSDLR